MPYSSGADSKFSIYLFLIYELIFYYLHPYIRSRKQHSIVFT